MTHQKVKYRAPCMMKAARLLYMRELCKNGDCCWNPQFYNPVLNCWFYHFSEWKQFKKYMLVGNIILRYFKRAQPDSSIYSGDIFSLSKTRPIRPTMRPHIWLNYCMMTGLHEILLALMKTAEFHWYSRKRDERIDGLTDRQTNRPSYRDARRNPVT